MDEAVWEQVQGVREEESVAVWRIIAAAVVAFASVLDGPLAGLPAHAWEMPAQPASYVILEPGTLSSPDGVHPVFRPANVNSQPARLVAGLFKNSYARQALVLHQYVKNYLAHLPGADPAVAAEPTYFVLGGQGGYATRGFWLEDGQGQLIDKRTVSYVSGLSTGVGYWGDLEQMFPHELGHAMLAELCGWQEAMLASQIHQVTMVTDYQNAFNEGWAEHFQVAAVEHTTNSRVRALREVPPLVGEQGPYGRLARELGTPSAMGLARAALPLWHAQREQHLRYAGVKTGIFAHQASVPEALLRGDDPRAAMTYQALIPPGTTSELKNGPQMLANEGLVSTLFWRLVSDPQLQQTYREPAFYEPFLPPGQPGDWSRASPQELFSPMDNVYLKLFCVLARHVRLDGDLPGESPAILTLKGYATDYPDEAKALYGAFLEVTYGVTVEPRALLAAQEWVAGQLSAAEHRAYLGALQQRLAAGEVEIDSALGPQIWLRNPAVRVSVWALDAYAAILPGPYNLNLNAATVADLCTVPGIDISLAREIVRMRDKRGGLGSLDDLASVPGMSTETLERLRGMQQAMRTWIDEGAHNPEDELQLGAATWVVIRRLLLQLAAALAVAGLAFALGARLQRVSARRLDLEATLSAPGQAGVKIRRAWRALATVLKILLAVVLPTTAFFALQFLLLGNGGIHGSGLALVFALAVWFLIALPPLGWHLVRGRLHRQAALHRAAWTLATYVLTFCTLGWLMGT